MVSTTNPSTNDATGDTAVAATPSGQRSSEAAQPGAQTATHPTLTIGEMSALIVVTTVAAVATCSLALAQLGRHDGLVSTALGLLVAAAMIGLAVALGGRPRLRVDWVELGLVAVVLAAALWSFLPGFPYAAVDKDPGVYVAHAVAIARDGNTNIDDAVVARGLEPEHDLGGRFPGIWELPDDPTAVTSQFYPLYSATLATAHDLGGTGALFNLTPGLAAGAVVVLVVGARRAFGTVTAAVMAALLITSAMQVWQAKYPSTEILAQLLLAGALLGGVIAVTRRWAGAAFVSGLLIGSGFLARPDGFLYLIFGAIAVAVAIIGRQTDRRITAFGAGLALTLPYAFYNAYVVRGEYSRINDVPGAALLIAVIAMIIGFGLAVRWLLDTTARTRPHRVDRLAQRAVSWRRPIGGVIAVAVGLVMLLLYHRETLSGQDFRATSFSGGEVVRSYAEMNMVWLSWFFSRLGLAIVWVGICVLLLQKWQAPRAVLVVPGLALLPLYAYDPRVSMRLMWWVRRFVPAVLPVMILLLALAIAWALTRRNWGLRVVGAIVLVVMLLRFNDQSSLLRDHREMEGSWELAAAIAEQSGDDQGVYLYPAPQQGVYDPIATTPGAVWWIFDQIAARLPADYDLAIIERYQETFPDQPVLLVTGSDELPPQLPGDRFDLSAVIIDDLVVLEETLDRVPEEVRTFSWELSIWRLTDAAA